MIYPQILGYLSGRVFEEFRYSVDPGSEFPNERIIPTLLSYSDPIGNFQILLLAMTKNVKTNMYQEAGGRRRVLTRIIRGRVLTTCEAVNYILN